jgi:chromate reductase
MNGTCNILGILGSLSRESCNHGALRAPVEFVPLGAWIEVFVLDGIPGFNQDDERHPPAKVVEPSGESAPPVVTPEYDYSIRGALKNAIDWASRPCGDNAWDGRPAANMGTSIGSIGTAHVVCVWQLDVR